MDQKSKRVCSIEITDAAAHDIHALENFLNRKDKHERLFGDNIYRWDKIEKKLRGKYIFTHEYMKKIAWSLNDPSRKGKKHGAFTGTCKDRAHIWLYGNFKERPICKNRKHQDYYDKNRANEPDL